MNRVIVTCMVVLGCKGKEKETAQEPPPRPVVTVDAAAQAAVVDAAPRELPMPKTKHGLVVFTTMTASQSAGSEPLQLVDPDDGTPSPTPIQQASNLVVGPHVIAGLDRKSTHHFLLDLRAPTLVAKQPTSEVEHIMPDDTLVTRCGGGVGAPFKICTSTDGQSWPELYGEGKRGEYDIGVIAAAGRELIHCNYTELSKLPAFSIRIKDKKRTDYPKLIRKEKVASFEVFYSPNGTKAATCGADLVVTTLDGSAKPQTIKLDSEPVRCTCRFSHDDARLACSILYEAKETGFDSLHIFDLAAGKRSLLAKEVAIGEFVWSPDDARIAYVGTDGDKQWVLRATSLDGKSTRDLFSLAMKTRLIELAGWTVAAGE